MDRLTKSGIKQCKNFKERTFDAIILITEKNSLNMKVLARNWQSSDARTFPTPLAIVNINPKYDKVIIENEWCFSEIACVFNYWKRGSICSAIWNRARVENEVLNFFRQNCLILQHQKLYFNSNSKLTHKLMINNLINMSQPEFYNLVTELFGTYYSSHVYGSPFWSGFWRAISFYDLERDIQKKLIEKWAKHFLGYDRSFDCIHMCDSEIEESKKLGEVNFQRIAKLIKGTTRQAYRPVTVEYDKNKSSFIVNYWAIQDRSDIYEICGFLVTVFVPLHPSEPENVYISFKFSHIDRFHQFRDHFLQLVGL
jgi:hypothetical protein